MSIRLDTANPDTWSVAGELTFASVPTIQAESPGWFAAPPAALDMAGVARIDSAGIALLAEWARRAQLAGTALRLTNVPPGMLALSATMGLDRLLKIDPAD